MQHSQRQFNYEITLYFGVYIVYLLYGLWSVFSVRDDILTTAKFEFASGWTVVGRPRDDSNDELENFTHFLRHNWVWYVLHVGVSVIVRIFSAKRQCQGHALVCAIALCCTLRLISLTLLVALLVSYYVSARANSKFLTWLLAAAWMIVINVVKNSNFCYTTLGYTEYFTLIIMLSWSLLRCCSFVLNRIKDKPLGEAHIEQLYTLEHFLGYTLYFPTLMYGPFLGFRRYAALLQQQQQQQLEHLRAKILQLVWELVRVAFWWCVLQYALHFMYIHYMARDVGAVRLVGPAFGQHAVGYFMGQFFFLYYVITYGLGIAFARFDALEPPQRPRCIGRIHFYSDMWKYFDEGLYEFLFRHIYAELCGKRSSLGAKLFATAATFAFVFVWHGCYTYVLIWSVLNFGCLVAEKCFKSFVSSPFYAHSVTQCLGEGAALRLRALLATQLFIPAAFSNVYFISGQDVGNWLMRGAYASGFWNYIALTFCSYCFFQCSEVILSWKKPVAEHAKSENRKIF